MGSQRHLENAQLEERGLVMEGLGDIRKEREGARRHSVEELLSFPPTPPSTVSTTAPIGLAYSRLYDHDQSTSINHQKQKPPFARLHLPSTPRTSTRTCSALYEGLWRVLRLLYGKIECCCYRFALTCGEVDARGAEKLEGYVFGGRLQAAIDKIEGSY